MALRYDVRPLSDRTWLQPRKREGARFSAPWTSTLNLLEREYDMLRGRHLVIEVDVEERMIRNDGLLRSDARPVCPAVVVAFESVHGPLMYRCDRFMASSYQKMQAWQMNVRAIALTLESLRAVDRYGAAGSGEQYRGWKALPSGYGDGPSHMTADLALDVLCAAAQVPRATWPMVYDTQASLYRAARAASHPDRNGGRRDVWDQVEQAWLVLTGYESRKGVLTG